MKNQDATESFKKSLDEASSPRRLPPLLRRAWYGLNQAFRRRIAHLGLTPDQFTVLRTLLEADPRGLTQIELSRRMASDANTITSLVRRMASARLIRREPHQRDGRAIVLRVRPEGRRQYSKASAAARTLQDEVLAAVPDTHLVEFLGLLGRIGDVCQAAAESSPKGTRRR